MLDVLKKLKTFIIFIHRITEKLENFIGFKNNISLKISTKCTLAVVHQLHSSEGQV